MKQLKPGRLCFIREPVQITSGRILPFGEEVRFKCPSPAVPACGWFLVENEREPRLISYKFILPAAKPLAPNESMRYCGLSSWDAVEAYTEWTPANLRNS